MAERRWLLQRLDGRRVGRALTRQAAMNQVDRPYRHGKFVVLHELTRETWERRDGSWIKTRDGDPTRPAQPAAAAADDERPEQWWQR